MAQSFRPWHDKRELAVRAQKSQGAMLEQLPSRQMEHTAERDVRDEREGQIYLRVAQSILAQTIAPLSAREIVERGIEQGLFGDHTMGRTPEKSMQARLSMDILSKRDNSRFMRTSRGRFQLRPAGIVEHDESSNSEYFAEKRVLRTPQEEVLCVSESCYSRHLTFQGVDADATSILRLILTQDSVTYVPRIEAEHRNDAKQFITYVFVQCANRLLYFKRSYLSRAAEFLRGSKCIGFGGHVTQADADLLSSADFGLSSCARRELSEELTLTPLVTAGTGHDSGAIELRHSGIDPRQEAIKKFQSAPLELLGALNDDSSEVGRRHVAVVYRIWLNDWNVASRLTKGNSSIKGLHWLDLTKDKLELQEFEYWSQLCIRKFFPANVVSRSSYSVIRTCQTNTHIIVTGRIGSGKSETMSSA